MNSDKTCPHWPDCSGCVLMGTSYDRQLERKLQSVRQAFEQAGLDELSADLIRRISPSPSPWAYRNRAKLVAVRGRLISGVQPESSDSEFPAPIRRLTRSQPADDPPVPKNHLRESAGGESNAGQIKLGLYRANSHDVVDIPACPIHVDGVNRAVELVRAAIDQFDIVLHDEASGVGDLRFVTVRQGVATGDLLIGLVTANPTLPRGGEIARFLMNQCPGLVGVVQNVNPAKGNVIFGPTTQLLEGRPYVVEVVHGTRIRLGVTSFFQVNTDVAAMAYDAIANALERPACDVLLDLYCGVGSIGLIAGRHIGCVIGVEEDGASVELARASARDNDMAGVEYRQGRVEECLPDLATELLAEGGDRARLAVVVNPPRKGLGDSVIHGLCELAPGKIAYLSCSPPSLVRDLRSLIAGGYRVRHTELFDMFPQTDQVETLAVLEKSR